MYEAPHFTTYVILYKHVVRGSKEHKDLQREMSFPVTVSGSFVLTQDFGIAKST